MTTTIKVPKHFRQMLKATADNSQRDADIKLLITSRKGMAITHADFKEATGVSSAMHHVQRLMRAGYITRRKVKQPGKRAGFGYKWHDEPLTPKAALLSNGGVVTKDLNLPPMLMSDIEHANLHGIFHNWIDEALPDGAEIVAVRAFIAYIRDENDRIRAAREAILKNKEGKHGRVNVD